MTTKAARGIKRVCQGCGAKFYDLNNDPIICPMCEVEFKIAKSSDNTTKPKADVKSATEKKEAEAKPVDKEAETTDLDPDLAAVEDEDLAAIEDVEDVDDSDSSDDTTDTFLPEEDDGSDDVNEIIADTVPAVEDEN